MSEKLVYLMRGLPACGKSHTARKLAGSDGIVLETDQYFYVLVGDDPARYDYQEELLPTAQQWNFDRFRSAIAKDISPIVVDRGNGLNLETRRYADYAVQHGYRVELKEPESEWWQEIRALLHDKRANAQRLKEWAEKLAQLSSKNHRVPVATIQRWMQAWKTDVTIERILNYQPSSTNK